jgi:hypothetical protein
MREIRIVITDTSVSFPDGQELGRVGEHNATQLLIELPAEMVEGIDYHIIKFSLLGGAITSDIITEDDSKQIYISDGIIYCTLWQQLTASRGLSFTVEAYKVVDGTPSRIAKSPLVSGLRFEMSTEAGGEADTSGYSLASHVIALDERTENAENDIKGLQEDSHAHANKELLDKYDGTGGVMVVDSLTDLPDDAAEGDLAYVRLETESDDGVPLDLSDCPKGSVLHAQIEAAYTAQGGTVLDSGWDDFKQNYTNCNFSAGALKLGVPIYRPVADIDAFFHVSLSLGTNYGERELLLVRPILFLVGSEVLQSEYTVFVPDSDYSYGYMSGCVPMGEAVAPKELVEDGVTKYIIKVATVYAFENLSGQLYNTGGMFDGLQINIARGWNSVALVVTEEFLPERVEILPQSDVYLLPYTFWTLSDIDDEYEELFARTAITDMLTDTTQSIIIPPALYIRADGEWRKTS